MRTPPTFSLNARPSSSMRSSFQSCGGPRGAGSGKTFMAVEQARRLAKEGQRVALICYSHGLASHLKRITKNWSRQQQPGYVGEFHALGMRWGAPQGPNESERTEATARFFEHELPLRMLDLANNPKRANASTPSSSMRPRISRTVGGIRFWLRSRTPDAGGIYVFGDEGNGSSTGGAPPVPLVPLILDQNIRNTRQIATTFQPLVGHPMRYLGADGPAVKFVPCSAQEAMDAGTTRSMRLEDGWRFEDVVLHDGKPPSGTGCAAGRRNRRVLGQLLGSRPGLLRTRSRIQRSERRAVVLVVNDKRTSDRSRERLYVGLSRARDQPRRLW